MKPVRLCIGPIFRAGTALVAACGLNLSAASADVVLPPPLTDADYLYDGAPSQDLVDLGQMLFFDPILSGNLNISCGTCHDPARGTGDGLALGIGEGGDGMADARHTVDGVTGRVPRNAQPLYNIGAREYRSMFHDGRLEPDPHHTFESGFWSPAREDLPPGLDNLLAAQAMFPVLSQIEMAGQKGENPVATAVAEDRLADAWAHLAARLSALPGYAELFAEAFPDVQDGAPISFVHAANALAAFQSVAFRSDTSPFDRVLRDGDVAHLEPAARRGMALFYGEAGCSTCHAGPIQTDHAFHAIAMPQIGPGKGHGQDTTYWSASGFSTRLEDEGRYRVTFEAKDRFAFRTPSLRNVARTGPWGHAGAYDTLEAVVRHHLDPVEELQAYQDTHAPLPDLTKVIEQTGRSSALIFRPLNPARRAEFKLRDTWVLQSHVLRERVAAANSLQPLALGEADIADIVAFLNALSDPAHQDRSDLVPTSVPSGLTPQPQPEKDTNK